MTARSVFLHSERFGRFQAYEGFPWLFARSDAVVELCRRNDLLERDWMEIRVPEPADMASLREYHTDVYLKVLERANTGEFDESMLALGLGTLECPVFPGCLDYHRLVTGSTLLGVEALQEKGVRLAFSPSGGMHHAGPDFASGFSYLNDPVLAIRRLLKKDLRILYVDIDVHHGDLVQEAFYDDARVLTLSFHESPETLFPHISGFVEEMGDGAAAGYCVNVPLMAGTGDEPFTWAFERLFPPLCGTFKPDVVVAVLGTDMMASDPMSNLKLTTEGYCDAIRWIHRLAPKILALGCGGYDLDTIARAWTLAWAVLNDIPISEDIELLFVGEFRGDGMFSLQDRPFFIPELTRRKTMEACENVVNYIETHHFAKLGIKI
jgi:acetoin utilization protein AcuC